MTVTDICIIDYGGSLSTTGRAYEVAYKATYTGDFDPKAMLDGTITGITSTSGSGITALPIIGTQATWDTQCYCAGVGKPTLLGDSVFTFTASFTQNVWIDTKDKADMEQCEEERELFIDFDEKLIVNSAAQVFENTISTNQSVDTIVVSALRTTLHIPDPSEWIQVNDASVTMKFGGTNKAFAAGTLAYWGTTTSEVKIEGGYTYLLHRWQIDSEGDVTVIDDD